MVKLWFQWERMHLKVFVARILSTFVSFFTVVKLLNDVFLIAMQFSASSHKVFQATTWKNTQFSFTNRNH